MTEVNANYDEPWKEAIAEYFDRFLHFFFPEVYNLINWLKTPISLDKELQKITADSDDSKRLVDKLFQVWLKDNQEVWILVHIEIQSQYDTDFNQRMFIYHYRTFDLYRKPVISLAILGDEKEKWRPSNYGYDLGGCKLNLNFPTIKLLDYQEKWAELERDLNPFAMIIMAHLKTKETASNLTEREQWKWYLIRSLYDKEYSKLEIVKLFKFIDALREKGKLDEAIVLYEQIIYKHPKFALAYFNLGNALAKQGKLDEAIAHYEKALSLNPNLALCHYRLGEVLAQQGELDTAVKYLEKAIELKPNNDQFKNSLDEYRTKETLKSKTLEELYSQHTGKVSDKWSLYLSVYDQILKSYKNMNVRLLEIGVQNGGSLEIWSQYFSNAKLILGCDINPECAKLKYNDPRIHVIVGDANLDDVNKKVSELSQGFDIIIDDGSHTSSDIVKSFAKYFPLLEYGGIYIAEDLHTSYWEKFQGGLFYPFSSITFFKHLIDIINHEHWGIDKKQTDLLNGFCKKYDLKIDTISLQSIHSITFLNSLCMIKKCHPENNTLGKRYVAGLNDQIKKGLLKLNNTYRVPQDQKNNEWSVRDLPASE
jgi:tetratricopeptide (TPR) repeat protein